MINSGCGCSGGNARPAGLHSLHFCVFTEPPVTGIAGQD
ncbi:BrxA/BrxB family bacilliredoxin [Staphylococcus aureus]